MDSVDMDLPERKNTRLKNYNYGSDGYYFVTICTQNRRKILSQIVGQGLAPAEVLLSEYGKIAQEQLLELENRYPTIKVLKHIIMPNHIHAIIVIDNKAAGASPRPTLSDVMCAYKSITSRLCKKAGLTEKLFQSSFHDHIIRGDADFREIWEYIDNNASNCEDDKLYID